MKVYLLRSYSSICMGGLPSNLWIDFLKTTSSIPSSHTTINFNFGNRHDWTNQIGSAVTKLAEAARRYYGEVDANDDDADTSQDYVP
jgi:hypothetical protein